MRQKEDMHEERSLGVRDVKRKSIHKDNTASIFE